MSKQLSEELEYPSLTTVYTGAHGFVFSIDRAEWEEKKAPKGFIGIVKKAKKVQCSSLDLSKRNEEIVSRFLVSCTFSADEVNSHKSSKRSSCCPTRSLTSSLKMFEPT